jgi:hypothetical protein
MPNDSSAPAGSRKYFLVQPDNFELLVKNFEEVQRVKQSPAVKLAMEFEKKVTRIRRRKSGGDAMFDAPAAVKELILHYNRDLCLLYKMDQFCSAPPTTKGQQGGGGGVVVKVEQEENPPEKSDDTAEPPTCKKAKWISFRK